MKRPEPGIEMTEGISESREMQESHCVGDEKLGMRNAYRHAMIFTARLFVFPDVLTSKHPRPLTAHLRLKKALNHM
jgi:hypothetical protein